jgi:DNA gyrase/topoisomerase IV subunit A
MDAACEHIDERLTPFYPQFVREVTKEDILKLMEIKMARILKFNKDKADEFIAKLKADIEEIDNHLAHITEYTIDWYTRIKEKYGKNFPRRTEIRNFDTIVATKVAEANEKLYINREEGFIGTGLKKDEDALKDMMASESISCGKSGTDVGENVLPVTEKEKNVPEVKTQGQEKSRKTIRADPGLEEKVEMYKELFLDRKKSVHRKQTYISYDMYCRLARILPLLSDDMSVPAFLDNVLAHHLETYSEELGELFRRKTPKTF